MSKQSTHTPLLYVRQDTGSGRPMVLLHGMFGDGTQWRVVADLLADYYRVIVVDLLGHGKSPRPEGAHYTATEHSLALRKTLEKIGATADATIVGYSMGGTVALQYAADYQDVAQLYMISTPFYLKPEEMVAHGYANSLFYTKLSVGIFRRVEKLLRPGKLLYKLIDNDRAMEQLHDIIDSHDNKLDPEVTRLNLKELINDFPFAANLAKVRAPITFYSGKRDVFVVQSQLRALKKIKPLMEIQTLGIVKNDHAVVQYLPHQIVNVLKRYHHQELNISYDKNKTNQNILVLLHGIESASSYWSNIIPALSEHRRVIAIDLLGFGKSPKPLNVAYSLDDQVKWVHRTLAAQGITSFELVGHSLGALVALAYAGTYPKHIKHLTLIAPVFVDTSTTAQRFIIKRLNIIEYFSDTSYLVSTVLRAVGDKPMSTYVPTIRSITNSIKGQGGIMLAKRAGSVDTTILYGKDDQLVDELQLKAAAKYLKRPRIISLADEGHNIPLFNPTAVISQLLPGVAPKTPVKQSTLRPNQFIRQLVKLASPILLGKGLLSITIGLLLFSQYKEEALVTAVATLVIIQSVQFIRGSFSLKNEGASYISYLIMGVIGALFGYGLTNHFDLSLRIALYALCGYVLANGLSRLLAGYLWTTNKPMRRKQLVSGCALTLVAFAALLGSLWSVYFIVYSFAAIAIVRGVTLLVYTASAFIVAYIRSYQ